MMKLIGMLDSPYVRRVAISLQLLGLHFEHQPLSVFRGFAEFSQINPVVKAPTLVCDDGTVMMDSSLILEYAQALARPRSLMPTGPGELRHALRTVGLALAACEKVAQIIYERRLRPPEKWHEPWLNRIGGQMLAAFDGLEADLTRTPLGATREQIDQAGVSVAVAWHFARQTLSDDDLPGARYPRLAAHSVQAEALPEFQAAPYGEATFRYDDAQQP